LDFYEQWENELNLAKRYFTFFPNGEDYKWFLWIWNKLDSEGYFNDYEHSQQSIEAHIALLVLVYEFYAVFENIDEVSGFRKLNEQQLNELNKRLALNSEKLLGDWIDFIQSNINEFVAELCTSYMIGAEQILPGHRQINDLYNSFLDVKGDIYANPGTADIYLSLIGYEGRSGKLTFTTIVDHFELLKI